MKKVFFLPLVLLVAATASARIINVPDDEGTIRDGIAAAENGDTVLVAPGVYQECITFGGNNIVVASMYLTTGDENMIAETIIDGTNGGGHSVVAIRDNEDGGTELAGFTIRNGNTDYGGGIYCVSTTPILHHLIIEDNYASHNGGGVYCTREAAVTLRDAIIRRNESAIGGGGITCYLSAVTRLENVVIDSNITHTYGGGVQCSESAEIELIGCTISRNYNDDWGGGGVWGFRNATITLRYTSLVGNYGGEGGAVYPYSTALNLDHVLIARNWSSSGSVINLANCNDVTLTNLTVVDNDRGPISSYGVGIFKNSIVVGLDGEPTSIWLPNTTVEYCDIIGGRNQVGGDNVTWGEGNIDADPIFVNPEEGDYSLQFDSPCIDAGNPDDPMEEDGTPADIGWAPRMGRGFIFGQVVDATTGAPIEGVSIRTTKAGRAITGEDGSYVIPNPAPGRFILTATKQYYNTMVSDTLDYAVNDTLEYQMVICHPECQLDNQPINVALNEGDSASVNLTMINTGNGTLTWNADIPQQVDPLVPRESIAMGEAVQDRFLYSAVWAAGRFYVTGRGANDQPQIYILSREGEPLGQMNQPLESHFGSKDIEWDGNWIWLGEDNFVCALDTAGNLQRSFPTGLNPIGNLAWDTDRNVLWVSGITTGMIAYDREGNRIQGEILRGMNLRKYGASYRHEEDGYGLYLTVRPTAETEAIYRVNPATGDTLTRVPMDLDGGWGTWNGCAISSDYDLSGDVMFTMISPTGSPWESLQVIQVGPMAERVSISPSSGELLAGQEKRIDLTIHTFPWDAAGGNFEGEVVVTHDAAGERVVIPVSVEVRPRGAVEFQLAINRGWNIVSAPVTPLNERLTDVVQPLVDRGILSIIKSYDGRFYIPAAGFCNLPNWDRHQAYAVKVTESAELSVVGEPTPLDQPIHLRQGWNSVAYLPDVRMTAEEALQGVRSVLEVVKDGNGNFYLPRLGFSNMGNLRAGQGYQVRVREEAELVWPHRMRDANTDANADANAKPVHFLAPEPTGRNMSLVVSFTSPLVPPASGGGWEVGVFTNDGLCVGSSSSSSPIGIAVWGDDPTTDKTDGAVDGEALGFRFWDGTVETTVLPKVLPQGLRTLRGDVASGYRDPEAASQGGEGGVSEDRVGRASLPDDDGRAETLILLERQVGCLSYATDGFAEVTLDVGAQGLAPLPTDYALSNPYPNPFNSTTAISYRLPKAGRTLIEILDVSGRSVGLVADGWRAAGEYQAVWNPEALASGVYLIRMRSGDFTQTRKVAMVR